MKYGPTTLEHAAIAAIALAAGTTAGLLITIVAGRLRATKALVRALGGVVTLAPPVVLGAALSAHTMSRLTAVALLAGGLAGQVARGALTGLGAIDHEINRTATALGLTSRQRIVHIGLPIARGTIAATVRWASFASVALVAALPREFRGGLGDIIVEANRSHDHGRLATAIALATAVAVAFDLVLRLALRVRRR